METSTLTKRTIQIPNGETLAYYDTNPAGNAKTLILLHSAYFCSDMYLDFISKLTGDFRVVAIDFRGHGDSSSNTMMKSCDDFVEDIKQVLDLLQIKKASFFGWSTGGGVSLLLAAKYPSLVEKVVLNASIGAKGVSYYKVDENGAPTKSKAKTQEEIFKQPFVAMTINVRKEKNREMTRQVMSNMLFNARGKPSAEVIEKWIDSFLKCKCGGYIEFALTSFNITTEFNDVTEGTGQISLIKCPVLILHGQKDVIIPVEDAKATKELLKDQATLHIFEDGGHALLEDYPEEMVSRVKEFLSS